MATHYLLPCPCGKKTEVDASQAGLTVRCGCGAELAVPAMRGLASLERVEGVPPASQAQPAGTWGRRQGTMFLGGAVLTAASLAALWFWWHLPPPVTLHPDYQTINRQGNPEFSLENSFNDWHENLQKGIAQPMFEEQLDRIDHYTEAIMQWVIASGVFAAAGLLLMVIGFCMPSRRSDRAFTAGILKSLP